MKHLHGSILLALLLSPAAPAYADRIHLAVPSTNSTPGFSDERAPQDASFSHNFGLGILRDDEFRMGPDSADGELGKGREISDLRALLRFSPRPDSRSVSLFELGSQHSESLRWDDERAPKKLKNLHLDDGDDGEGSPSTAAIPEPGSLTLLLFGIVMLGIVVHRRSAPANGI